MEFKPTVNRITIFPVKSLDGISLQKAQIGKGGCLLHDREYAIIDSLGKYVNGKSNALIHQLRLKIDFEKVIISLKHESAATWDKFHLQEDKILIDEFLSAFFNKNVSLLKNTLGKFLDKPVTSGITLLSTASLKTVGSWFNNMHLEETRKRFRATIEITSVPAFWEDRLFGHKKETVEFSIGEVVLYGMSPRARFVVPARHPENGELTHAFQRSFADKRDANLPGWSTLNEYGHAYYLSVDCYVPPTEFDKWITEGDEIRIIGKKTRLDFAGI